MFLLFAKESLRSRGASSLLVHSEVLIIVASALNILIPLFSVICKIDNYIVTDWDNYIHHTGTR